MSFLTDGKTNYGAVVEGGVIDLGRRSDYKSLLDLRKVAAKTSGDLALDLITFQPPVITPEKILCVGVNYANRNEEYKDGSEPPKYPSLFFRTPGSFVGHGEPIVRPKVSSQLDYEGEIALVIGRGGRHVPREHALSHIAGLTLANEGSVRECMSFVIL